MDEANSKQPEDSTVAVLRRALDARSRTVSTDPDAWRGIRARIGNLEEYGSEDGGHAAVGSPLGQPQKRRGRGPWIAAAAAAAFVAGGIAVAHLTDREHSVEVLTPASGGQAPDGAPGVTAEGEPASAPAGAAPTGWYVPQGLTGWSVKSIDLMPSGCDGCRTAVWANADRSVSAVFVDEPGSPESGVSDDTNPPETRTLSGSVIAEFHRGPVNPSDWSYSWVEDGRYRVLSTHGVAESEADRLAEALRADPRTKALPGLDLPLTFDHQGTAASVQVNLTRAGNEDISYQLSTPGSNHYPEIAVIGAFEDDRQELPLRRLWPPEMAACTTEPDGAGCGQPPVEGDWPGAYVRAQGLGASEANLAADGSDRLGLDLMVALRPATSAEWRAYLDTSEAPVAPELREAETLADLG